MLEIFLNYWLVFLLVIVSTSLVTLFTRRPLMEVWKAFVNKAPIIKKYWFFVLPFSFLTCFAYIWVINSFDGDTLTNYLSVLGQVSTLVFAIFVGYFAFVQVTESRLDKLSEKGLSAMREQAYRRSKRYYEQAYIIDPKDFSILCNLLELYLLMGDYISFDEKINHLSDLILEPHEKVTLLYLKTIKSLLKQDIGSAKVDLGDCIDWTKENPSALVIFSWDFRDIQKADVYKKLSGDCRTILDNYIKYLSKTLSEEDKKFFEDKNYSLTKQTV
jgi:tetratricopeptide (TPR) repeat protein